MPKPKGPSRAEVLAAHGQTMPDIIAPNLDVLFCGINPSLYSVVIGHHFGRPGNRFWKAIHQAGFTHRLYDPSEDASLIDLGYGITNMAPRATARADELSKDEIKAGQQLLAAKVKKYQPKCLAFLGITAYRIAFAQPKAKIGPQPDWEGISIWALPNPSGLNAHYQVDGLAEVYGWVLDSKHLRS
ncbi:MAG: G/U mismatch-specific DNA glycosylase [Leptolyngbya foveolarum]|uniref:G/U mismatch-specific DNA glycosylase n=1 Tax=Leptolyngbya foveolarum TaxID=47253 RepID=A0A2W4WDP3_9CYAN|nr:MAG: G/U mismatch-specific DNA glycosylase [Leptolyngbya foveolarum]